MNCAVRQMLRSDIGPIAEAFASMSKTREQYERYFEENETGGRVTLVAFLGGDVVGYTNILWQSYYEPFQRDGIPEINDLNVVEEYRNQGIATSLIRECERLVHEAGNPVIGIGVGLTPVYAPAQHLYPKLVYISDGRGVYTSEYGEESYFLKEL